MGRAAIGVVVIGRNEGERLRRCIESLQGQAAQVVYVDSDSSDGSAEWARSRHVEVVPLAVSGGFTAGRARNAGLARLLEMQPELQFVQFVDGDCEVMPQWMANAAQFLLRHSDAGVVCGRRRERFPDRSIFNAHCDREWNTPVGEARACGGDAMMRVEALLQAGGFLESLIAGEEPELCLRLRAAGWRVWRIDLDMTLHDAAILRWDQWWKRTRRSGYAFAEGALMHGAPPERHWVAETRRALLWGVGLPMVIAALMVWQPLAGLLLAAVYPLQFLRLAMRTGTALKPAWSTALLLLLGRLAEAAGVLQFWVSRYMRRGSRLIEYK